MLTMLKRASTGLLALALLMPVAAVAQEKAVPQSRQEMQLSFSPLVKQTAGAVVNVYAERVVQRLNPFAGDPFFEQFFGQRMPNRSEKQSSLGSGVILAADGLVVTNNHVIEGADDIKIALADGREFPATWCSRTKASIWRCCGSSRRNISRSCRWPIRPRRSRRSGSGHWQPVRRRADGDERHRFSTCPQPGHDRRFRLLHPDRRLDQSGQFRRRADEYERRA